MQYIVNCNVWAQAIIVIIIVIIIIVLRRHHDFSTNIQYTGVIMFMTRIVIIWVDVKI